jgi:hypothetical protein
MFTLVGERSSGNEHIEFPLLRSKLKYIFSASRRFSLGIVNPKGTCQGWEGNGIDAPSHDGYTLSKLK